MIVVFAAGDAVDIVEAHVEPDGGVERAVLVDTEPRQFAVKGLGVGLGGEVAVLAAAVGNGAADAMDELLEGVLPLSRFDVAVEVFAGDDLGGQLAPGGGHFNIILGKNGLAAVAIDPCGTLFPVNLIKGMDLGVGEMVFDLHTTTAVAQRRAFLFLLNHKGVLRVELRCHLCASVHSRL